MLISTPEVIDKIKQLRKSCFQGVCFRRLLLHVDSKSLLQYTNSGVAIATEYRTSQNVRDQ